MTSVGLGRQSPPATSLYRLVRAAILMPVASTDRGPQPLFTRVGELACAVGYTEAADAEADCPQGYRVFQIQVVEAVASLPSEAGLIIDPRAVAPILLTPADREAVLLAAAPFPVGPPIRLGLPDHPPAELYEDLAAIAGRHEQVLRVLACWYSVADANEMLLVAVVTAGDGVDDPDWEAVRRECAAAAAARRYPYGLQVVNLAHVPEPHQAWITGEATEVYRRSGS